VDLHDRRRQGHSRTFRIPRSLFRARGFIFS
jgi:hypothetical protein